MRKTKSFYMKNRKRRQAFLRFPHKTMQERNSSPHEGLHKETKKKKWRKYAYVDRISSNILQSIIATCPSGPTLHLQPLNKLRGIDDTWNVGTILLQNASHLGVRLRLDRRRLQIGWDRIRARPFRLGGNGFCSIRVPPLSKKGSHGEELVGEVAG